MSNEQSIEKRWAIISLASVPLIMTLGNSMLIPILPVMEKKLDISSLQSSYIITVYSIVAILFIPIAGYLSDRYGRKIVIVPALILTGIGGLIAGFAAWKMDQAFTVILIGRILQGIGASGAMPIVLPLVGDMFRRDNEASSTLGIIETSNTIGKVLSPILGSALAAIVWFLPFFSIPVFCTISVLMIIFLIKNKTKNDEKPMPFKEYWGQIKDVFREHKRWLIAIFLIGAILVFLVYRGWKLDESQSVNDLIEDDTLSDNQAFNREQKLTLLSLALMIIAIMTLQTHAGLTALVFSFLLLTFKAADEAKVFKGVPWDTIFLIVGMSNLLAVIAHLGGMEYLANFLASISGRWTAAPLVGLTSSFMSFFSLAMAGPVPALVPTLESLNASIDNVFLSIELLSTVFNNGFTAAISPLSLGGAMVLTAYVTLLKPSQKERQKKFGELFAIAIGFSIVGALLSITGIYALVAFLQ